MGGLSQAVSTYRHLHMGAAKNQGPNIVYGKRYKAYGIWERPTIGGPDIDS